MLLRSNLITFPWLNDKSTYKLKQVNQPKELSKGNAEPPYTTFFSAATKNDVVIDLNKETEQEKQRKEQEDLAKVADILGLGGEDSISDENSGLDPVSEDEC